MLTKESVLEALSKLFDEEIDEALIPQIDLDNSTVAEVVEPDLNKGTEEVSGAGTVGGEETLKGPDNQEPAEMSVPDDEAPVLEDIVGDTTIITARDMQSEAWEMSLAELKSNYASLEATVSLLLEKIKGLESSIQVLNSAIDSEIEEVSKPMSNININDNIARWINEI